MRKILIFILLAFIGCSFHSFSKDYIVKGKIKGMEGQICLLAQHYGNKQYIKDTLKLDDKGSFTYTPDTIEGGIYMLVFPKMENKYFEIVLSGDEYNVQFETDSKEFSENMNVINSKENKLFYQDMKFLSGIKTKSDKIQKGLEVYKENKDSVKVLRERMKKIDKLVKEERLKIIESNPDMVYAKVLNAMREIDIPEPPRNDKGEIIDSMFQYHYYKKHYWDLFDLSDSRLMRTPIFHTKLETYFDQTIVQSPDSIITTIDRFLQNPELDEEFFKYTLVYILNKHAKSKIMGMDKVYVHLVDNYYSKGKAGWISKTDSIKIADDANRLRPLLIGQQSPNIRLKDLNDRWHDLYNIDSKYTLVYIWDPDCGHCKKVTPKLGKMYKETLKDIGLTIFAISTVTHEEKNKWTKFLDEHDLHDFINVHDMYLQTNFRDKFDVQATPVIFLLDENKKIIAKRIDVNQLPDFIKHLESLGQKKG